MVDSLDFYILVHGLRFGLLRIGLWFTVGTFMHRCGSLAFIRATVDGSTSCRKKGSGAGPLVFSGLGVAGVGL
jgi:hypothetical protein